MKIAILTSFVYFRFEYSLTGIVLDQARMLTEHGHDVTVICREGADLSGYPGPWPVKACLPDCHLIDYASLNALTDDHREIVKKTADVLARRLTGFDLVLTHDLVFTGWNLPYALGIQRVSPGLPGVTWLHWIHSIPSVGKDWWHLADYGPNHFLVYPNRTDAKIAARFFHAADNRVLPIPHIKDMRSWADFSDDTCRFIRTYPGVIQADMVEVLPASQDRLQWKRVPEVIGIFGRLKKLGRSVCLVIANQWASQVRSREGRDLLQGYERMTAAADLEFGREVIFTSEFEAPRFEEGIPKRMVRELFQLSNMFIFPTHHESFGLVVPEAALSGAFMVLNSSLAQQREVSGSKALFHPWGSYNNTRRLVTNEEMDQWAGEIMDAWRADQAIQAKTFARQHYNWDAIYRNHYQPIIDRLSITHQLKAA